MVSAAFTDLVGQDQAIGLLTQALRRQRIAPGYLFVGAAGVGRALAATAFAAQLLATEAEDPASVQRRIQARSHPDLRWVEPTYLQQGKLMTVKEAAAAGISRKSLPQIRLEQIREVTRFLSQPPLEARRAVVVIENAERMAEAAANALLKTLEEPGPATLILIAADQQRLLPTLISRCQGIPFRRLNATAMAQVLTSLEQTAVLESPEILALAQGSPGAAIASWQQLQSIPTDLLQALTQPRPSTRAALETARQVSQALDTESQLWLLDYLQHHYWRQAGAVPHPLEQARQALLSFVQPRLVWEVTLMQLATAAKN
jgi:DNA polymerase-3 subunit delta'